MEAKNNLEANEVNEVKHEIVIIDRSKKPVELNDNIQASQREFLDSVTAPRTECDRVMVDVCSLTPKGEYAFLVWDTEFLGGEQVKRMVDEKMFPNNLETMMSYTEGVMVPPQIAFAVLGSIRAVVQPPAVHMMDGTSDNGCRIVFCER